MHIENARLRAMGGALALAALLASPPAMAQPAASTVTIYGLFDAAMRHAGNVDAAGNSRKTMEDGIMTGSRLGLRAREDLGGGWAALMTIESGFDPSSGLSLQGSASTDYGQVAANPRFWGREAHIGLRTPFGGLTLGRQYTVAHTLVGRFQPQGNPNSTAHSLFSSHHVPRNDNMLRVDTKAGPVDLSLSHTFGEQATGGNGGRAIGLGHVGKGWAVGAYHQRLSNAANTETRTIVGLGGNYKVNDTVHLYGGLMKRTARVSPQENQAWTLGANIELTPQVTLSLAHYDDEQSGSAALDGQRTVSWVTANYRFSRRTDVYAVIDRNQVSGGYARPAFMGRLGTQNGFVLGLRHRF
jgi:predicted porin